MDMQVLGFSVSFFSIRRSRPKYHSLALFASFDMSNRDLAVVAREASFDTSMLVGLAHVCLTEIAVVLHVGERSVDARSVVPSLRWVYCTWSTSRILVSGV